MRSSRKKNATNQLMSMKYLRMVINRGQSMSGVQLEMTWGRLSRDANVD